ncbi:hypothetical protein ACP70R_029082 [Stipagrostis hirtigluma subsp. patula]
MPPKRGRRAARKAPSPSSPAAAAAAEENSERHSEEGTLQDSAKENGAEATPEASRAMRKRRRDPVADLSSLEPRTSRLRERRNVPVVQEPKVETSEQNSEWKKLQHEPPPFLELMEQIFDGVAVDGSSSYVPGQMSTDGDDDEQDDDVQQMHEDSPRSNGSHKRGSSTSTTDTSPNKKNKSPILRMMNKWFVGSTAISQHQTKLFEQMVAAEKERFRAQEERLRAKEERQRAEEERLRAKEERQRAEEERERAERKLVTQLALDAGIKETSAEYYALSFICNNKEDREFFMDMQTNEGRVAYLTRWCKDHNLT